jgi:signal transduction histidine kinase
MAFGAMLAITLGLVWYFYDSVQWFEYDVRRIALVNSILDDHQILAAQTAQKLNFMQESVALGEIKNISHWEENNRALETVFSDIKKDHEERKSLRNIEIDSQALSDLDELEGLVATIMASGEEIRLALEAENIEAAVTALDRFNGQGAAELFNALMNETLVVTTQEVADANQEAKSQSQYITGVLPFFMLVLVLITFLVVLLFSRSLTRSFSVLHSGVKTFTGGDLNYRIPELKEREFEHLGQAFNTMALELAGHRNSMHDSNVRLEAVVDERTRALKSSNDMLAMVDENRRKLLADISHEFRTPLTVIRGEAEIAIRGKAKTKAAYIETLERIVEQSDQATRLVDDLLFMARADAGEPRLKVRPVSVGSLLGPVCSSFSAKAKKTKVALKQSFDKESAVVMGDPGRLRQVFAILVDNALQYSKAGDTVEVSLERNDREIIVLIRDNGIGLTEEEAKQAFQRFFRGGKAQGHARGTGLGLPVAKAIIEAHKGRITLEGRSGKGAVATVVLPAEDKLKAVA